jgi:hypothetical protein
VLPQLTYDRTRSADNPSGIRGNKSQLGISDLQLSWSFYILSARSALLVSVGMLILTSAAPSKTQAEAACNPAQTVASNDTLVCQGDLSQGIWVDPAYSYLNVENVTGDVGLIGGVTGVEFINDGAITVASDTGDYSIVADGPNKDAVYLSNYGGNFDISFTQAGGITSSDAKAVSITSFGDIAIDITGNVTSQADAIHAEASRNDGNVTLTQTGDIHSEDGNAIYVQAPGAINVSVLGDVTAQTDAISLQNYSQSDNSNVVVDIQGSIQSTSGSGIKAISAFHGTEITNDGSITAHNDAIHGEATGNYADSAVTIQNTGTITSAAAAGISATSSFAGVIVNNDGDINVATDGIFARMQGNSTTENTLSINQIGDINASTGYGVNAEATFDPLDLDIAGVIYSSQSGIRAVATGNNSHGTVNVVHTDGLITSTNSYGIEATSSSTDVTVTNTSDIRSSSDGIHATMTATSSAGSYVTVDQTGDIQSSNGYGIFSTSTEAGVSIYNDGDITAALGGIYASASGLSDNSTVVVDNAGDITVTDGSAIFAHATTHAVNVTQGAGTLSGGDYGIHAESETTTASVTVGANALIEDVGVASVYLRGITGTNLVNYGEIDGGGQSAVVAEGYGGSTIDNYGVVDGTVDFASGVSTFNNKVGSVFNIGNLTSKLGSTLYNDGTLSIGGNDTLYLSSIEGNFDQSASGLLLVDVSATEADQLIIDGRAAIEGGLKLNFSDVGAPREINVLQSDGIEVQDITVLNTAFVGSIRYQGGTDVILDLTGLNFGASILDQKTMEIGNSLTAAYDTQSSGMSNLFTALANIADDSAYQIALNALSPRIELSQAR